MKKYFLTILILFFTSVSGVEATILNFIPEAEVFAVGQEFYVDIKIDTENDFINAVQSTITYPKDKLEAIGTEKINSILNFWVEEPIIFNDKGIIGFVGGASKGASGGSLQILRVKFKAISIGSAEIGMYDSAVTANDGKGTNVLSTIKNTIITISETKAIKPIIVSESQLKVVEVPKKIQRVAVVVKNLPDTPILRVPLYPDSKKWYNYQEETSVFWEVKDDVTKVAISVNNNPNSEPNTAESELFTGENIGILDEGLHYIHVQFKNNKGWGKTAHYRIAIDTTPPIPFESQISFSVSDNPTPEIKYKSEDNLSGYSHSLITVDNNESIRSTDDSLILPIQKLGKHHLVVKVFDNAGNSIEDDLNFEILPLETPKIEFLTRNILQGDVIFISGKSISNKFVDLKILKGDTEQVSGVVNVDTFGEWKIFFEKSLPKGNYTVVASARDERGAVSYKTEPQELKVKAKTTISLGFVDLSFSELLIIIMLIILSGAGFGVWYYITENERQRAYRIIIGRDVKKMAKLLENSLSIIEDVITKQKRMTKGLRPQVNSAIKKMKIDIKKIKKYLGK